MTTAPRDLSVPHLPVVAVLLPFALVFALCNYYRTVNAVLAPHLISELSLTAGQLGLLISVYFLVSALFQAPLGLLMDRFGPRRVQATLIVIAGIGAIIFALGDSWTVLLTGRVIMGIGAAGGLMTSLQAVTLWFPAPRWPFFNGMVMSIGALGSLAATLPTQYLLDLIDWHHVMVGAACVGVLGSLLLFGVVPEKTKPPKGETLGQQLAGMAAIYRDRLFWRFAPLYLATTGSTMAFQSLWAGPWLHDVAQLDASGVAGHLLVLSLLQIGSYFLVGFIATELGKRRVPLTRIVLTGSAVYILSLTPLLLASGAGRWSVLLGHRPALERQHALLSDPIPTLSRGDDRPGDDRPQLVLLRRRVPRAIRHRTGDRSRPGNRGRSLPHPRLSARFRGDDRAASLQLGVVPHKAAPERDLTPDSSLAPLPPLFCHKNGTDRR